MQHARILIVCRGITLDSLRVLCDLLSNLAAAALPLKCYVSCCLRRCPLFPPTCHELR